MPLSPLTSVPVIWQNALVDIHPTSRFGADHDVALVSTVMQLQAPHGEDVTFILPEADAPAGEPVLRLLNEAGEAVEKVAMPDQLAMDAVDVELAAALQQLDQANRAIWDAVKANATTARRATASMKAGQQLVRFQYPVKVPLGADGVLELKVLAPLASFVLAGGGDISFAVGLPRVPNVGVEIVQASAENPEGTPIGELEVAPPIAQRHFRGHYWRYDPLYRIRYRYQ